MKIQKNLKLGILLLLLMLILSSCSKTFTDIEAFEVYVRGEESPFRQQIIKKGVMFTLTYLPTDCLMIEEYREYSEKIGELMKNDEIDNEMKKENIKDLTENLDELKNIYLRSVYFTLKIGYTDPEKDIIFDSLIQGTDNYQQWLNKLLFSLKDYIYLYSHEIGEVPLALYKMDRTYGTTKDRTFLLSFPSKFNNKGLREQKNLKLKIEEIGLHTGSIVFDKIIPKNKIKFKLDE